MTPLTFQCTVNISTSGTTFLLVSYWNLSKPCLCKLSSILNIIIRQPGFFQVFFLSCNIVDLQCFISFYEMKWNEVAQACPTLCDPVDCSLPGSSVHGIFQVRVLEWGAISFSRGSSRPRKWTWVSCIIGRQFTVWDTREVILVSAVVQLHTHTHIHTHTYTHMHTHIYYCPLWFIIG